jgi:hypothetical protein
MRTLGTGRACVLYTTCQCQCQCAQACQCTVYTWAPISWTAHGANNLKDAASGLGPGQFGGPADVETMAMLPVPVCTTVTTLPGFGTSKEPQ